MQKAHGSPVHDASELATTLMTSRKATAGPATIGREKRNLIQMIYVDDIGIPAKVWNKRTGRHVESRWYHLISDQLDPAELHAFAVDRLGLHRSYFQEGHDMLGRGRDPGHDHYDLTVGKRKQAIALGAKAIGFRELAVITMAKTQTYRNNKPWMDFVFGGFEWEISKS